MRTLIMGPPGEGKGTQARNSMVPDRLRVDGLRRVDEVGVRVLAMLDRPRS